MLIAEEIQCGCGYVLLGDEEDEMLRDADEHVRSVHPELVGTLSPLELARPSGGDEPAS
jgi:Protein of unknown function (DUF1059)